MFNPRMAYVRVVAVVIVSHTFFLAVVDSTRFAAPYNRDQVSVLKTVVALYLPGSQVEVYRQILV